MRAWRIERHGGLEVLELREVPVPEPGPGEVLVRLEAIALNHLDLWVRKGVPGHRFPLPLTPVSDGTGRVEAVGPGVGAPAVGEAVLIWPATSCGRCRACQEGRDQFCPEYSILGEARDGLGAEYAVLPAANLAPRPEGLDPLRAAAFPLTFLTAWNMVVERARVQPGERVLVRAAGSGVGSAALQICRLLGARVAATAGSATKLERARALGAEAAFDHARGPVAEAVRAWSGGGVEVVLDHVGRASFADSLRCLRPGGRYVTCGATTGPEVELHLAHVFFKSLSILGATMGSRGSLHRITELIAAGRLEPAVGLVLHGLEALPDGHRALEARQVFGKVVLDLRGRTDSGAAG
ncbi:MAG: alcohol dehydrogenase [Candidatus Dadabacteria bacterium]|nr:MAG: alcohol dehydrogenase [Candidatus Dadabacteria bacterium]